MLDEGEKTWLNDYHRTVYTTLASLLEAEERAWLENAIRPVS